MMYLLEFISWLAGVSTVGLYLTGISICQKIVRKGNSADSAFFPFVVMFCNTTLWVKYALMKADYTMLYSNGIGSLLNLTYIFTYYFYTLQKGLVHKQMLFGCVLLFPILVYIKWYATDQDSALSHLGLFCASVGVLGYGAPLSSLAEVMRSKSTECMAFPLSLANFVVAVEWFVYGHLLHDWFIQIPNLMGIILGAFQLILFWKYPSTKTLPITVT